MLCFLLLVRGRDQLETKNQYLEYPMLDFPYSLGDAIDWKQEAHLVLESAYVISLLARGRDRLEIPVTS